MSEHQLPKTTIMYRMAAYDAHRILRVEGTKYEAKLRREHAMGARLVEHLRPHLKTECSAMAYDKAIASYVASLK